MINRDPRCVFVADSLGLAEAVALYLKEEGIAAEPMDVATLGGFDGLTWLSRTAVSARGIEIWVKDPADVERATTLLEARKAELEAKAAARTTSAGPVTVVCDECGHSNTFAGSDRGKVENCAACGAHVDVPGEDDEDWSEADQAGAEGE